MQNGQSVQQMVLGKLDIHMQKNEDRSSPNTILKKSSVWVRLSIRAKTTKLLEEYTEEKLHDTEFGNVFFEYGTKNTGNKEKTDKLNFINIKNVHQKTRPTE